MLCNVMNLASKSWVVFKNGHRYTELSKEMLFLILVLLLMNHIREVKVLNTLVHNG